MASSSLSDRGPGRTVPPRAAYHGGIAPEQGEALVGGLSDEEEKTMPVLFTQSFRVCFLLAAAWAAASVPLWLAAYWGVLELPAAYGGPAWHAHELVFGYGALVVTGFLFTAIPNWTGRPPPGAAQLTTLAALWIAGRLALASAETIGLPAAATIDGLFLLAVVTMAAREVIAGDNRRNLVVVVLVGLLLAANAWFHVSAILDSAGHSHGATHGHFRAGIAVLLALIVLIGGRIVPNFTRNWLSRSASAKLPAPTSKLDMAASAAGVVALLGWIFAPDSLSTGVLALVAGLALLVRLARWRGWETWREPLLAVLHAGYLFVPAGFLLLAGALLAPDYVPHDAALHAWTAGAIGVMTLAVMTRASLGHTGRPLAATPGTTAIYGLILAAALLRTAAPFVPEHYLHLIAAAGLAWTLAFGGFVAIYGPFLLAPRLSAGAAAAPAR
jgi:uncharacterized protein involved in response to NO